jgi:hypothetical protein
VRLADFGALLIAGLLVLLVMAMLRVELGNALVVLGPMGRQMIRGDLSAHQIRKFADLVPVGS